MFLTNHSCCSGFSIKQLYKIVLSLCTKRAMKNYIEIGFPLTKKLSIRMSVAFFGLLEFFLKKNKTILSLIKRLNDF